MYESDDDFTNLHVAAIEQEQGEILMVPITVDAIATVGTKVNNFCGQITKHCKAPQSFLSSDDSLEDYEDASKLSRSSKMSGKLDRKLSNREAAKQCRMRKKSKEDKLMKERLSLMSDNNNLMYQVQKLRKEFQQLENVLKEHKCTMLPSN